MVQLLLKLPRKIYYEKNKEKIKEQKKEYNEKNKDKIIENREKNKDKIIEKAKEKIECDLCGKSLTRVYVNYHKKHYH